MNLIGRITQDAKVKDLTDDRQVVEFSVAVNRYYKPKGSAEGVTQTTYFNCSYWRSTALTPRLKKGALVEMNGGLTVNAYTDLQGNPRASLNFHVDSVNIYNAPKPFPHQQSRQTMHRATTYHFNFFSLTKLQ